MRGRLSSTSPTWTQTMASDQQGHITLDGETRQLLRRAISNTVRKRVRYVGNTGDTDGGQQRRERIESRTSRSNGKTYGLRRLDDDAA